MTTNEINTKPDPAAKITGVVLSGGKGRRMGGRDKGLLRFAGRPMAAYAIASLEASADEVFISANRHIAQYAAMGYPVLADEGGGYDGPLAGVHRAMCRARNPLLLTVPCDSPLVGPEVPARLASASRVQRGEIWVASDGHRLQPVFALYRCSLAEELACWLARGGRRMEDWIRSRHWQEVDCRDLAYQFDNINTPEQLASLEAEANG